MGIEIRSEWPMDSYLGSWKMFRQAANENESIARHLIARPSWPHHGHLRICDVGCGDGRLLETLILELPDQVKAVTLIDPDPELLDEAEGVIRELALVSHIDLGRLLLTAEEAFPSSVADSDVVLLVHMVYLMESDHLANLLDSIPLGTVAYFVFDEPKSVFTTLWKETAPKYHDRVTRAHDIIRALPSDRFTIEASTIVAEVPNPFEYSREDVQDAILSLLCYSSEALAVPQTRKWIESTVRENVGGNGQVVCRSACYEVRRKSS